MPANASVRLLWPPCYFYLHCFSTSQPIAPCTYEQTGRLQLHPATLLTLLKCVAAADDDDMSDSDDDEDLDLFGEMTDEEKEAKAKKDAVSSL